MIFGSAHEPPPAEAYFSEHEVIREQQSRAQWEWEEGRCTRCCDCTSPPTHHVLPDPRQPPPTVRQRVRFGQRRPLLRLGLVSRRGSAHALALRRRDLPLPRGRSGGRQGPARVRPPRCIHPAGAGSVWADEVDQPHPQGEAGSFGRACHQGWRRAVGGRRAAPACDC